MGVRRLFSRGGQIFQGGQPSPAHAHKVNSCFYLLDFLTIKKVEGSINTISMVFSYSAPFMTNVIIFQKEREKKTWEQWCCFCCWCVCGGENRSLVSLFTFKTQRNLTLPFFAWHSSNILILLLKSQSFIQCFKLNRIPIVKNSVKHNINSTNQSKLKKQNTFHFVKLKTFFSVLYKIMKNRSH